MADFDSGSDTGRRSLRKVARIRRFLPIAVVLGVISALAVFGIAQTGHKQGVSKPGPPAPLGSLGAPSNVTGSLSVAGEAPLTTGGGFWIAYSSGVVQAVGSAVWRGDMSTTHLNAPIVGIAATEDGLGYWLVGADGGIFGFGDARFYGSTGSMHLNSRVIAMASTGDSRGYWLLGGDGGIFSFGDARFYGSTGSLRLNKPVEGMTPTPDGKGYWLVASDGGIFSFGNARFHGSTGSLDLTAPIAAMAATASGEGYWLLGGDGRVFAFGDAPFKGSATASDLGGSAKGIVRAAGNGYWILSSSGVVLPFGAPVVPSHRAATPLAASVNPSTSITPSAAFNAKCLSGPGGSACDTAALGAINSARRGEALAPLALPANFETLGVDSQSIVIANAERTSRGLPALVEKGSIDALAQQGAVKGEDPSGPANSTWGSNMSWGYLTPLAADFEWMYGDGVGSSNIDCTAANTSGCWGHRQNILSPWSGYAGAGSFNNHGTTQLSQLFVEQS